MTYMMMRYNQFMYTVMYIMFVRREVATITVSLLSTSRVSFPAVLIPLPLSRIMGN